MIQIYSEQQDSDESYPTWAQSEGHQTQTLISLPNFGIIDTITGIINSLPFFKTPTQDQEITYITGVNDKGAITSPTFETLQSTGIFGFFPSYNANDSSANKWAANGTSSHAGETGGTVNFYFDPSANWSTAQKDIFASGLSLWSSVADINFQEVNDSKDAQLTFFRNDNNGSTYETSDGLTFTPAANSTLLPVQKNASIHVDTTVKGWDQIDSFTSTGGYGVETVLHEEGHALGLGHGGPYNGNVFPWQQYSAYDNRQWSIMSYNNPGDFLLRYGSQSPNKDTNWQGNYPTTLSPLDIQAVQRLYGVAKDTPLSGGQTFGFNTNIQGDIRKFFDFTVNKNPVITLWDKGTNNTLDLSGYNTPATVNLNANTFSSFDNMTNNLAIAANTSIDNVIGGGGDDKFYINNHSDFINGLGGENAVIFPLQASAYDITSKGNAINVATKGTQIASTLQNIQTLQFSDKSLSVSSLFPSLASASPSNINFTSVNTLSNETAALVSHSEIQNPLLANITPTTNLIAA